MRKIIVNILIVLTFGLQSKAQTLSPYIKVGDVNESMSAISQKVIKTLKDNGFTVIGSYHPAKKASLKVIAFTRPDFKYTVVKVKDRGALAAAMRVGLVKKGNTITVSYTNPEYVLRAYLQNDFNKYKSFFNKFSNDIKQAFSSIGSDFAPFGGKIKTDKLKKYHYKFMMPYFTDPVELKEFSSFAEGVKTIEANLKKRVGQTVLVYKIKFRNKEVAVYGVGLLHKEDGEPRFLPKIGVDNVAGMPYEIILQGKKATILHGKYRLALYWPDLSMGKFMKIMSTPGEIEDTFEKICK
jgi:uncharacterized protein (DUF302 family)